MWRCVYVRRLVAHWSPLLAVSDLNDRTMARPWRNVIRYSHFAPTDHDLARVVQAKDRLQAVAYYCQGDAFLFFHSPNWREDVSLLNSLRVFHTCY
jgi:hypothetical protein